MNTPEETVQALERIPGVEVLRFEPLARHTRFGIGGPAEVFAEADRAAAFVRALELARASGWRYLVIGGGTNLIVSDEGFPGLVLRFTGKRLEADGETVTAQAGATLQDLVDVSIDRGLKEAEKLKRFAENMVVVILSPVLWGEESLDLRIIDSSLRSE